MTSLPVWSYTTLLLLATTPKVFDRSYRRYALTMLLGISRVQLTSSKQVDGQAQFDVVTGVSTTCAKLVASSICAESHIYARSTLQQQL